MLFLAGKQGMVEPGVGEWNLGGWGEDPPALPSFVEATDGKKPAVGSGV